MEVLRKTHFTEFIVFIPETQEIKKCGQIKVLENIGPLGHVVAHPLSLDWDMSLDSNALSDAADSSNASIATEQPDSYLKQNTFPEEFSISARRNFNDVTEISSHFAWFDSENSLETYAVIGVKSKSKNSTDYVKLSVFLSGTKNKKNNYDLVRSYLSSSYLSNSPLYHLFAITPCVYYDTTSYGP